MKTETLERIIPDLVEENESTGTETLQLHLERYVFATEHLTGGLVLDCACGVGYGSYLMADSGKVDKVIGVDIDAESVAYAKERYKHEKTEFINSDGMKFTHDKKFDTITSLETIEHVPDPKAFIAHLKSLLKPGGMLIGSVPTTPSVDVNPHHISDFTKASFRKMFTDLGFEEMDAQIQIQKFSLYKIVFKKEKRAQNIRKGLIGYYIQHPDAFFKRIYATLRYGYANHYITIVWKLKA